MACYTGVTTERQAPIAVLKGRGCPPGVILQGSESCELLAINSRAGFAGWQTGCGYTRTMALLQECVDGTVPPFPTPSPPTEGRRGSWVGWWAEVVQTARVRSRDFIPEGDIVFYMNTCIRFLGVP